MKIVVLGGAGDMGSLSVEDFAAQPDVELVTIADYNEAAAHALAERLSSAPARIEVRKVDANDHAQLVAAIQGHDLCASALGPFFKFEPLCVRASIEARVNYVSICDDWIACEQVLDGLDAPAREAGVVVVTGMGASPGITNLLAVHLADGMEQVRRIDVSCYQPWSAGGGEAVLRHLLFIISGEIAAFRGGRAGRAKACSETAVFEMPRYGKRQLWNLGHAEPVSLPRHFSGLGTCNFYMGMGTGMGLLVAMANRGWFDTEAKMDRVIRLLAPLEKWLTGGTPGLSAIRVDVWGTQDGKELHRFACGTGTMRACTGYALSVGGLVLARGQGCAPGPGVFAPESALPLEPMLDGLRARGVDGYYDTAMTQPLQKPSS